MKKRNEVYQQIIKYWPGYCLGILLVSLDGFVTYLYPQMITNIIDKAIPSSDVQAIIINIIWMALCQIISIFVALALSYVFCRISNSFILKVKFMLINAIFQIDGKEVEKKSDIFMSAIGVDVSNIEILSSRMLADLLMQILTVIITAVILIQINPIIFWFMIAIYPILIVVQIFFNKMIMKQSRVLMRSVDIGYGLIKEFVFYVYEYLMLNGKAYYSKRFGDNEMRLRSDALKQSMMMSCNRTVPQIISTGTFLAVLAISCAMVVQGELSPGKLTIIIMYTQRMFNPLSSIMLIIGQYQKAKVSVGRINQIIGSEDAGSN